jgi:aromatic-L-amino-acid decarboxylase
MLTATLAAQCMLWETSPAATELEERMIAWLRDLLGLPAEFTGSIQDSASASNLCGIIAACGKATSGRVSQEGLAGGPSVTVYASSEAHSSVEKGARIAGIGAQNVRKIGLRDDYGMDPAALADAIARDRAAGRIPACIVACFGATGLGSIDPLEEIGPVARAEDIHLHVDAAWAGSALILPEVRDTLRGLEYVDSFVFNPHKWLFTNFDCSAFYMRDPSRLVSALSLTPTYLESQSDDEMPEYRDWSIALARRFRALKLWFVLRSYGAEGLREMIRDHIAWTQHLAGRIRDSEDFELVTEPSLALLSFRFRPKWAKSDAELDRVNEDLLRRINDSGRLYLTKTRAQGRIVIRFVIGQTYTTLRHVEEGWACILDTAARMPCPARSPR